MAIVSVLQSNVGIVSNQLNISWKFFPHHSSFQWPNLCTKFHQVQPQRGPPIQDEYEYCTIFG